MKRKLAIVAGIILVGLIAGLTYEIIAETVTGEKAQQGIPGEITPPTKQPQVAEEEENPLLPFWQNNGSKMMVGTPVWVTPPLVNVTLQGSQRPFVFDVPLTLKLYNTSPEIISANILSVWDQPLYEYSTATGTIDSYSFDDETGTITFSVAWDCPQGTYQVLLYSPHSLVNKRNNVVINQSESVYTSTFSMGTLLDGDAQDITEGSLEIGSGDFPIFATAYETHGVILPTYPTASTDWNEKADFDRDLWITIADFNLFYSNYGKTSPQTAVGSQGVVNLSITPPEVKTLEGDTFTADIEVDATEKPVVAIAAYLKFDPEYLEVVRVTPSDTLSLVFANRYDNTEGTIAVALGRAFELEPASGYFTAATIEFRAKKATSGTAIAFEHEKPARETEVVFGLGYYVLGTTTDGKIEILAK